LAYSKSKSEVFQLQGAICGNTSNNKTGGNKMVDFDALAEVMGDLDEDSMVDMLNEVMADGGTQAQAAMEACQKGMDIVGQRFESGEYFVGDLIYAGELMTTAVSTLKDALVSGDGSSGNKTKMLLCTVKDDLHDIGKNIVRSMLEAAGFEVIDLGIDVPASKIVETVKAENIKIVALSGVLTLAIDSMKKTIDAIKAAGLNDVKVIIGGAPVSEDAMRITGADEWAHSPQKTVSVCQAWSKAC
jgi:dimethylamine corrinoid protein